MSTLPEKYTKVTEKLEQYAVPQSNIYHYTDWCGLKGILESQQLWLSDYKDLNDTSEIRHAIQIIRSHILDLHKQDIFRLFWSTLFDDIENFIYHEASFFICSFCESCNYLYAWRTYSNDGAGYSIGFKKDFFVGSAIPAAPTSGSPNFGRSKVYYNSYEEILDIVKQLMEIVELDIRQYKALDNSKKAISSRIMIARWFLATLLPFIASIKHPAYVEENEYRAYTLSHKDDNKQKFVTLGSPDSPHLNSRQRIYFTFKTHYISEIWVGPRLNFEHARYSIELILQELKNEGHDVDHIKIYPSDIPYRKVD